MIHDNSTIGYDLSLAVANVSPQGFTLRLEGNGEKKYEEVQLSYLVFEANNDQQGEAVEVDLTSMTPISQDSPLAVVYRVKFTTEFFFIPKVLISVTSYLSASNTFAFAPIVTSIDHEGSACIPP